MYLFVMWFGVCKSRYIESGWGGFDRAKLNMLILIRIPFSFHVYARSWQRQFLCRAPSENINTL